MAATHLLPAQRLNLKRTAAEEVAKCCTFSVRQLYM
jgi:hypothetical protein